MTGNNLAANLQWLIKNHALTNAELARRCNLAEPVLYRLVARLIDNSQINTIYTSSISLK